MRLTLLFFARLRRELGVDTLSWNTETGPTVREVAEQVETAYGVRLMGCMVAVNDNYTSPEHVLADGDEVAFLPPVAGGSEEQTVTRLSTGGLALTEAEAFLVRPAYGAQAYFVGTVRSPNKDKQVEYIDYEGFEPLAVRVMAQAADAARAQHGDLRVFLEHRVGRLHPGEASILIGVASPHRRAALEACDFLIEFLKVQVPVWKREVDETGEHWVEGQSGHATL